MKFDIPSALVAGAILAAAALNRFGIIGDDLAYAAFISVLVAGFATARREACRLECGQ